MAHDHGDGHGLHGAARLICRSEHNSATFTNVPAGDTSAFKSWFNPSNAPLAKDIPSPLLTLTSTGTAPTASREGLSPSRRLDPNPYGLTNETIISLTGGGRLVPDVVFSGTTQVLRGIPEPASLSLLAAGFPLAIWGWISAAG